MSPGRSFIVARVVATLHVVLVFGLIRRAKAIWPLPQSMSKTSPASFLRLDPSFAISLSPELGSDAPQDLLNAMDRTFRRLWSDKLGRLVVGRGVNDLPLIRSSPTLESLVLSIVSNDTAVTDIAKEAQKPVEKKNEKYTLTIPSDGAFALLQQSAEARSWCNSRRYKVIGQLGFSAPTHPPKELDPGST